MIHVERDGQKPIVLGKGGARSSASARPRAPSSSSCSAAACISSCFVEVTEDWAEDRERYEAMRLDFES